MLTQPTREKDPNIMSTSMSRTLSERTSTNRIRFMDLSYAEVTYFIEQVGMSAASFGAAQDDVVAAGTALGNLFNYRYSAPAVVVPSQGAQLQSICTDSTCPIAANATMDMYASNITHPSVAISSLVPNTTASATGSATGSKTSSSTVATASTAGAITIGMSFAAVAGGVAAMFL